MSKIRVADYIAQRLVALGVDAAFVVTGGAAMHLNDAIGRAPALRKIYCHHEQAAAMAAESYARIANKPALVNVTAGPGGINALNGVFGAYTDSIPMIVISGQVKRETSRSFNSVPGLRQLGDQEADIISMVQPITKFARLLRDPSSVPSLIDEGFREAVRGRPGPVWIDVPIDLQGAAIDLPAGAVTAPLEFSAASSSAQTLTEQADDILDMLAGSRRPVLLGGSGVRIGSAISQFLELAERLRLPVLTAWMHDLIATDHELFVGRPGTIGTRAGNFVLQNADLVIVVGSRLNIRQVSYNWSSFARNAKKIWIDIDPAELMKPFVKVDMPINAEAREILGKVVERAEVRHLRPKTETWLSWCRKMKAQYTPKPSDYLVSGERINAYHFIHELFTLLTADDIVVCGDATATIVPFQIASIKDGMRLISNSGAASMGHDIPAAIGAAVAAPGRRVICLAGDGSSMMNIQELQTVAQLEADIKIFILDNDGYLSIKQTQRNFFGVEAGSSPASGITFPDFIKVGRAFGLPAVRIGKSRWKSKLADFLRLSGPCLAQVELDLIQEFEPRLKSKMVDGVITTPELDDMHPFLPPEEMDRIRREAAEI
jgi:acetolactate synthase I/II/III large subunit